MENNILDKLIEKVIKELSELNITMWETQHVELFKILISLEQIKKRLDSASI